MNDIENLFKTIIEKIEIEFDKYQENINFRNELIERRRILSTIAHNFSEQINSRKTIDIDIDNYRKIYSLIPDLVDPEELCQSIDLYNNYKDFDMVNNFFDVVLNSLNDISKNFNHRCNLLTEEINNIYGDLQEIEKAKQIKNIISLSKTNVLSPLDFDMLCDYICNNLDLEDNEKLFQISELTKYNANKMNLKIFSLEKSLKNKVIEEEKSVNENENVSSDEKIDNQPKEIKVVIYDEEIDESSKEIIEKSQEISESEFDFDAFIDSLFDKHEINSDEKKYLKKYNQLINKYLTNNNDEDFEGYHMLNIGEFKELYSNSYSQERLKEIIIDFKDLIDDHILNKKNQELKLEETSDEFNKIIGNIRKYIFTYTKKVETLDLSDYLTKFVDLCFGNDDNKIKKAYKELKKYYYEKINPSENLKNNDSLDNYPIDDAIEFYKENFSTSGINGLNSNYSLIFFVDNLGYGNFLDESINEDTNLQKNKEQSYRSAFDGLVKASTNNLSIGNHKVKSSFKTEVKTRSERCGNCRLFYVFRGTDYTLSQATGGLINSDEKFNYVFCCNFGFGALDGSKKEDLNVDAERIADDFSKTKIFELLGRRHSWDNLSNEEKKLIQAETKKQFIKLNGFLKNYKEYGALDDETVMRGGQK